MSVYGPTRASAPWPNRGRGRGTALSPATSTTARSAASQAIRPERDEHPHLREQRQLAGEERRAVVALRRQRLVRRRRAADGGGDVRADRARSPSSAARDRRLVREPDRVHRREQEVARRVAGEHPPGPVAAVRGRRQPDEQDPRVRIAEPRHRPAPVRLVAEARHLLAGDLLPPRDEPRAATARDDLRRQGLETRPPLGRRRRHALLEQQPVEPPRHDEQPDDAHHRRGTRRGRGRPSPTTPDRERAQQVDALVERRQPDDDLRAPADTSRPGRTCPRTGTSAGSRAGSGRSPATSA